MRYALISLAGALLATSASAADLTQSTRGYTYFNRPGATATEHEADLRACMAAARPMSQPIAAVQSPYAPGYYPAGVSPLAGAIGTAIGMAIVAGVESAIANHRGYAANVENCMVVRGWRVVTLTPEEGAAIAAMRQPARAAQLAPWIGAAEPHGTVARAFGNDVARQHAVMFSASPGGEKESLSLQSLAAQTPEATVQPPSRPRSAQAAADVKIERLAPPAAGNALVVVRLIGDSSQGIDFERVGPSADTPAYVDGRTSEFTARPRTRRDTDSSARSDTMLVFELPAGRWRIAGTRQDDYIVSFCLGSPSFEVAAGDVVYAGAFDLTGEPLGPSLQLGAPRLFLSRHPDLQASLRPAHYVNGSAGRCAGAFLYSYELDGAGFDDGYRFGSRAPAYDAHLAPTLDPAERAPAVMYTAANSKGQAETRAFVLPTTPFDVVDPLPIVDDPVDPHLARPPEADAPIIAHLPPAAHHATGRRRVAR